MRGRMKDKHTSKTITIGEKPTSKTITIEEVEMLQRARKPYGPIKGLEELPEAYEDRKSFEPYSVMTERRKV